MVKNSIMVGSITHAIRGRDILRSKGYKAFIEKTKGRLDGAGCGYSITLSSDPQAAAELLRSNGIKVLGIDTQ
ncbi:MAG: DUF3343 domain-containing protein [Firmicutes bacterium]|nr:DUF3343 domain-containing protein [Bacillota bacterium]